MTRWLVMLLSICCLLAIARPAPALSPPSLEQWDQYRNNGQDAAINENILRLSKSATGGGATDGITQSLVTQYYGINTTDTPDSPAREADLDHNNIVDERDLLELGYRESGRGSSMILSHGTEAAGNQPKMLVLLVKFSDQQPTDLTNQGNETDVNHDRDWATRDWFSLEEPASLEDTSVAYYYQQASNGQLEIDGGVFYDPAVCDSDGWITSAYTREQVDGDGEGDTNNPYDVIIDLLGQVDPYLDFSDYDANHDGYVDGIVTVYAGGDDITTNMWHFWWHTTVIYYSDNARVICGIWTSEEAYIQMWCHETGHQLGLQDLYDLGGDQTGDAMPGIGVWGLMGDWTIGPDGTGAIPAMPCAWSRMKLRWTQQVETPTTETAVNLVVNRATSADPTDSVFRLARNGWAEKEYFLVEYRDATHSWDQNLPGDGGLLIWHVDENRTSRRNHDNAFDPQRVWLECAESVGDPWESGNPWKTGHNGDDGTDYFGPSTTPNSRDNSGFSTYIQITPLDSPGGSSMEFSATNHAGNGLPGNSWDTPADGSDASGSVLVDVTSNANLKVEYYVDNCLKYIETGPAPYIGFNWNTLAHPDGPAELTAVAYHAVGVDPVRVIVRSVNVNNGSGAGADLPWSESFDTYSGADDPVLLNRWNLHDDRMGVQFRLLDDPAWGDSGYSLAFAQTSFPTPNQHQEDDPNAGVYEGKDDDWLMLPRINLDGWTNTMLDYKASFRQLAWGQGVLVVQLSNDEGSTWQDLESATYFNFDGEFSTGKWLDGLWAQRSVPLSRTGGGDVFIRFLLVGGVTHNTGFAIDDVEITGTENLLATVTPQWVAAGESITLSGSGFGSPQGNGEVRFSDGSGGYIAQPGVVYWLDTEIVCLVPDGTASDTEAVWVYQDYSESVRLPLTIHLAAPVLENVGQF